MCGLHMPLFAGCTIVYLDEITGDKIKAAIKKYKVSFMISVPRILDLFQKGIVGNIPKNKLPTVLKINKVLRYTPVPLRRKFFAKVHTGLGPTLKTLAVGGAPLSLEVDKFFQGQLHCCSIKLSLF
jgi:long-subunit acyl-CoA synthetase (AMP-forming)